MSCEQIINQLSAWMDGELSSQQSRSLEEHLAGCADCHALADELRAVHDELSEEFSAAGEAADRVAGRVVNQLPLQQSLPWQKSAEHWSRYAAVLAALAAGFALAYVTLPRGVTPHSGLDVAQVSQNQFAVVRVSTGPVEVAPSIGSSSFARHDSPLLEIGMKLRTGRYKSELQTPTGVTIRLDAGTQISVPSAHEVILEAGRLWCQNEDEAANLAVSSGGTQFDVTRATCDIKRDAGGAELIALDGAVQVRGDNWQSRVETGNRVRLAGGKIIDQSGVDNPVIETRWIHDLLLEKRREDAELQKRVEQLWAALGYSKVRYLYEEELRALGAGCVNPLSSFLCSQDEAHQRDHRRVLAAEIVADVADFGAIPRLIDLLNDSDADVRFHMARGLRRLTGRDMGIKPEQWKEVTADQMAVAIQQWREWFSARKASGSVI